MAGARFERQDRRVGHELDVRHRDLRRVGVQGDGAVHLRDLVDERRRVVDFQLDPAGEEEAQLLGVGDDDQAARVGVKDVVDALTERRSGGHHLQCLDEPGLLATLELASELIPSTLRHEGRF